MLPLWVKKNGTGSENKKRAWPEQIGCHPLMCVFVNLKSTPLLADTREMLLKGHRVSGIQVLHPTIPHLDMWANRLRWQVERKVST